MKVKLLGLALASVILAISAVAHADDRGLGISVGAGTPGIGLHLTVPVAQSINARFGVNAFSHNYNETTSSNVNFDLKLKLATVDALVDWYPLEKSGFRLTGGVVYNGNSISGTPRPTAAGTYTIQGNTYASTTAGNINADIDFRKLAPYVGIGWGNVLDAAQGGWTFNADLGVLYQGSPNTSLTNSGCTASAAVCAQLATDLTRENAALQDRVNGLRAYPVVRLGVGYRF